MPAKSSKTNVGSIRTFGKYGPGKEKENVVWVCYRKSTTNSYWITRDAISVKAFDSKLTLQDVYTNSDNVWRDATLRYWLNSDAPAGKVNFGPHHPPAREWVGQAVDKTDVSYASEGGFLSAFTPAEKEMIVSTEIETEVVSSYSNSARKKGKTKTDDKVFLLTWEEWKKLPPKIRESEYSTLFRATHPSILIKPICWTRSPLEKLGVAIFGMFDEKKKSNSGSYNAWGIRPCIMLCQA